MTAQQIHNRIIQLFREQVRLAVRMKAVSEELAELGKVQRKRRRISK